MSYDFCLATAADLDAQPDSEDLNPGPPVPEKETAKRALAQRLMAENAELQPFLFDFVVIAAEMGISETEARARYRHIELNGRDDGNGIQITLFDDHADLTVPYWHDGEAARAVFEEIWRYLRILEQSAGYVTYDGQLNRVIDLSADFEASLARYSLVVAKLPEILASADEADGARHPHRGADHRREPR